MDGLEERRKYFIFHQNAAFMGAVNSKNSAFVQALISRAGAHWLASLADSLRSRSVPAATHESLLAG